MGGVVRSQEEAFFDAIATPSPMISVQKRGDRNSPTSPDPSPSPILKLSGQFAVTNITL
ncbi:hypothetical protein PN441_01875 [Spirulina major CS-329]|uniref:hypothetical protein n=1 Tax=Spirulina TaxID=1154 RepID=UPI00232F0922|nr:MULTISPECIES: hypothetical protein [Spirulina]MDB9496006.1 hypothetical protein [Spirulina subsalsa CS-330]MDB9501803.1 hypothetical protein [Spirulina major CS-329]